MPDDKMTETSTTVYAISVILIDFDAEKSGQLCGNANLQEFKAGPLSGVTLWFPNIVLYQLYVL